MCENQVGQLFGLTIFTLLVHIGGTDARSLQQEMSKAECRVEIPSLQYMDHIIV